MPKNLIKDSHNDTLQRHLPISSPLSLGDRNNRHDVITEKQILLNTATYSQDTRRQIRRESDETVSKIVFMKKESQSGKFAFQLF